jgi:hypothetical protein
MFIVSLKQRKVRINIDGKRREFEGQVQLATSNAAFKGQAIYEVSEHYNIPPEELRATEIPQEVQG